MEICLLCGISKRTAQSEDLRCSFKAGVTEKLPMHCITVRCIMDIHAVMSHILPVTGRWTTL